MLSTHSCPRTEPTPLLQSKSLACLSANRARTVRGEAKMSVSYSLACIAVLGLLSGSSGHRSALPNPEILPSRPVEKDVKAISQNQLNISASNTALAFEPYQDLTTRFPLEQENIFFSPLGLASASASLCRISGSESQKQTSQVLGIAANASHDIVEATITALEDSQHNLTLGEGEVEGGVQNGQSEATEGVEAVIGRTTGEADAANSSDVNDETWGRRGTEDGYHARGQLGVWSNLHVDGKPSLDFEGFLSSSQNPGQPAINISFEKSSKDSQGSDKLVLSSFVYFKGQQSYEQRHKVQRSFQLNATTSVEVDMMFSDDSSEVMMSYDTNCSATVVRSAFTGRVASSLSSPKGEIQPSEDCLSDSRMGFWLNNLKPGRAEIRFPKFQVRKSYSLESISKNAGISSLFLNSDYFSNTQERRRLKLHEALHEVMSEMGESRSGKRGRWMDVSSDFSVPQRITFDRPFVFIIYDHSTELVSLIGRITDPTNV